MGRRVKVKIFLTVLIICMCSMISNNAKIYASYDNRVFNLDREIDVSKYKEIYSEEIRQNLEMWHYSANKWNITVNGDTKNNLTV